MERITRNLAPWLSILLMLVACGDSRTNYTTLNEKGEIVLSDESRTILEDLLEDYKACKESETENRECDRFTAEAFSNFYGISDFKKEDTYVVYKDIQDIIKDNGQWEKVGAASSQSKLERAQALANNGVPTIAFDPKKTNHVAIVLPGKLQKSLSWNLQVPNSASFFVHKADGYVDKSLSYAFRSPENIVIYYKK